MTLRQTLYESYHRPRRFVLNLFDTPALILLYHRVTSLEHDPQMLAVSPENFYQQMDFLRKQYHLHSPESFTEHLLSQKPFPKHSVLVTFDDGYADNVLEALPILESMSIRALFYITTSLLGTDRELWWDDLERIILLPRTLPNRLMLTIRGLEKSFSTASASDRYVTYESLHPLMKYIPADERERILSELYRWASVPASGRPTHRMMTPEELRILADSPAAVVGAHTHSHTALSALSPKEQRQDIQRSHDILQNITGVEPKHFSYPYGLKKDYTSSTLEIVKSMGYDIVCSNYFDHVHSWTPRYELPRMLVRNWDFHRFQKMLRHGFLY